MHVWNRDDAGVITLAVFKSTRESRIELKAKGPVAGSEPCWDCRMIVVKLAEHGHIDESLAKVREKFHGRGGEAGVPA